MLEGLNGVHGGAFEWTGEWSAHTFGNVEARRLINDGRVSELDCLSEPVELADSFQAGMILSPLESRAFLCYCKSLEDPRENRERTNNTPISLHRDEEKLEILYTGRSPCHSESQSELAQVYREFPHQPA